MAKIRSIIDSNGSGILVDIECYLSNSLPNIVIVGFANKAVDEAKERIRGALASSNIKLPKKRITLNLAPADIPKEGSYFDFPILVAILHQSKIVKPPANTSSVFIGEVGLDGSIRSVRGIIGKILAAKKAGITTFWVPKANLQQALLIPNITIYPIDSVLTAVKILNQEIVVEPIKSDPRSISSRIPESKNYQFDEVIGQHAAKRALEIAAAGHHNIMLTGPPGTGKSMLGKALIDILPPLTHDEMLETTHIHSLATKNYDEIKSERPFRSPHHSASSTAIVGGGQNPKPGEISLSHNGVLLFDEFPEFSRQVIESLRQPIEDRSIIVSRAKDTIEYPAHFLLVATANPCPCGYFGSRRECTCLPHQIVNYQRKMSGPILDRIDLFVEVEEIQHSRIISQDKQSLAKDFSKAIERARNKQLDRSQKLNSQLNNKDIRQKGGLSTAGKELLDKAAAQLHLSARSYIRTLKVARSIADLEDSEMINTEHVSEALQYRKKPISL